jgi:hypothetical protein
MTYHRFRLELGGRIAYGVAFDSEPELEAFITIRGVDVGGSAAMHGPDLEPRERGRPSRDEEIAAAIDALDENLDRYGSIKAQARAVREHLKDLHPDDEPPGLSTVETYISVYRKPRKSNALKIAQKIKRG